MATVGLVPRIAKEEAAELAREMARWLQARGHQVLVEEEAAVEGIPAAPGCDVATRADLLVVLGGDGTLIHAAGLCGGKEVPILGVNLGTMGFLTEVPRDIDGRNATVYEADGLIVATPTGSTAYSLSAAGPIVYPTLDAILVTPICPHALTQRPLVLPPNMVVRVRLTSPTEMSVTLDGSRGRPLELGEEVWIRQAAQRTIILRNPELDPFTILRQKLRWGTR